MKFNIYRYLLVTATCLAYTVGMAQNKDEREFRIDEFKFPEKALKVLELIPEDAKRLKYYHEFDEDSESYEAKFKLKGSWYSAEFDTQGILEDVEVKIKFRSIPKPTRKAIETYLDTNFDKRRFIKIQKQFSDNEPTHILEDALNDSGDSKVNFEIVIEVFIDKQFELREMTFSEDGQYLDERKIEASSYEHILY